MDYYRKGGTTPHLRLVFTFLSEEPSSRVLAFNSAYEYTIAKQNGGGVGWVELFITLTRKMGEPTYGVDILPSFVASYDTCSGHPVPKLLSLDTRGCTAVTLSR